MFKSVMSGVALAGAAALLSTSALAEGLPDRRGPVPYSWTGFYVGVNAGWAWGDADFRSSAACPDVEGCAYPSIEPAGEALPFIGALGTGSVSADGFTGGVQAGYLAQSGRFVFGYEVDFNALDLGASRTGLGVIPNVEVPGAVTTSFSTDWLLTARARLGVTVAPTLLAYVTGGLAVSEINVTNSFADTSAFAVSGSSSHSDVRTGWTVGGGVEWALGGNWTVKGEYLYVDLGSVSTTAGAVPADFEATPNTLDTEVDLTTHIGRVGVNYRF